MALGKLRLQKLSGPRLAHWISPAVRPAPAQPRPSSHFTLLDDPLEHCLRVWISLRQFYSPKPTIFSIQHFHKSAHHQHRFTRYRASPPPQPRVALNAELKPRVNYWGTSCEAYRDHEHDPLDTATRPSHSTDHLWSHELRTTRTYPVATPIVDASAATPIQNPPSSRVGGGQHTPHRHHSFQSPESPRLPARREPERRLRASRRQQCQRSVAPSGPLAGRLS